MNILKDLRNKYLFIDKIINWFIDPYIRIKQEVIDLNERKKSNS